MKKSFKRVKCFFNFSKSIKAKPLHLYDVTVSDFLHPSANIVLVQDCYRIEDGEEFSSGVKDPSLRVFLHEGSDD